MRSCPEGKTIRDSLLFAETRARRALQELGIDGKDAGEDIRDLRSLLAGFRMAKRTAVQAAVRIITAGILIPLVAGIAIKLKIFGVDFHAEVSPGGGADENLDWFYVTMPRLFRYSIGLRAPSDILIRFSLYHRM